MIKKLPKLSQITLYDGDADGSRVIDTSQVDREERGDTDEEDE